MFTNQNLRRFLILAFSSFTSSEMAHARLIQHRICLNLEAPMKHPVFHFLAEKIQLACRAKALRFIGLLGVLTFAWACYPVTPVTYSNPQEVTANQWLIEYKTGEEKVQLTMRYSRKRDGGGFGYSNSGFRISPDQLVGLTREQAMSSGTNVKFQLKREAGTFNFEGWFKEGNGSGHFTFEPSSLFASELNKRGFGTPTFEQQLSLAMSDLGFALINELKAQGYEQPTLDQLVRIGNHGVRLEYVQGLKALGYSLKSTEFLVRLKDHGVSLKFIQELAALGYTDLTPEELVRTRDHGVTADFISEFTNAGYGKLSMNEWVTLRDHGVSTEFVRELEAQGYSKLPIDELRRMRDHGVSMEFIQELKQLGYDKIPVDQLIRLKNHGVSAAFIKKMKEQGYKDLTLDEFVRLRNRGERE